MWRPAWADGRRWPPGLFQLICHGAARRCSSLSGAALARQCGGTTLLREMRGAARRRDRVAGVGFALGALSLIGLPLLAGFAAKLTVMGAARVPSLPQWAAMALLALSSFSTRCTCCPPSAASGPGRRGRRRTPCPAGPPPPPPGPPSAAMAALLFRAGHLVPARARPAAQRPVICFGEVRHVLSVCVPILVPAAGGFFVWRIRSDKARRAATVLTLLLTLGAGDRAVRRPPPRRHRVGCGQPLPAVRVRRHQPAVPCRWVCAVFLGPSAIFSSAT